jgi:LDH2 family malate/lactate/ureidoglycolate dehydrogenase
MAETAITVSHTRLQEFIVNALGAMKMPRHIAEVTAGLMVRTDLRGVDSHGIGMLPRYHELWRPATSRWRPSRRACATKWPPGCWTARRASDTTSRHRR